MTTGLKRLVVDLLEVRDFPHPPVLHEIAVQGMIIVEIIGGLIGGFIGDILGFNISHDTLILAALEDFLKGGLGGALCLGSVRMLVR